jgi:hypothetical protein
MTCPKCQSEAHELTPIQIKAEQMSVFGCPGCGFTFTKDGIAFVRDGEKLRDTFRGATLIDITLTGVLSGEKLNPATKAMLNTRLMEYGLQMWFDGLKQGLLMGAIYEAKGKVPPGK